MAKATSEELVSQQEQFISGGEAYAKYKKLKDQKGAKFISIKDIPLGSGVAGKLIDVVTMPNKLGKKGETKDALKLETGKGEILFDCIWSVRDSMNNDPNSFIGKDLFLQRVDERLNKKTKKMMQIVEVHVK